MRNTLKEYLDKLALVKRRQKRTLPVLIGLSALVAFNVTWQMHQTGISMSGEILCELEEHSHSEECYEKVLICDSNDAADSIGSTEVMAAEPAEIEVHVHSMEEGCFREILTQTCPDEEHVHGPGCYQEVTNLVCGMEESEEHVHEESCYETTLVLTDPQPEHIHTESCFTTEQVLECTIPELSQPEELTDEQMEPALPHIHTEECYEEQLTCELEEHVHSDKCHFANQVDVEDPESWMDGMDRYFTGNPRRDLVIAAVHQLGYTESKENVKELDGGQIHGYTRYGHWFGTPYNAWNATFASFALWQATPGSLNVDESGMPTEVHDQSEHQMVIPFGLTALSWQTRLIHASLWNSVTEENRENPATMIGSVIFLNTEENGLLEGGSIPAGMAKADRVAIVIGVDHETGMLKTIEGEMHGEDSEGNTFKYVGVSQIGIHEPALLGYLMPPELPAREPELIDDFFYTNTFSMETEKEQVEEETEQPAEEEELLEFSFEEYGGISLFAAAQREYEVVRVTYSTNLEGSSDDVNISLTRDGEPQTPQTITARNGISAEWQFSKEKGVEKHTHQVTASLNGQSLQVDLREGGKLTSLTPADSVKKSHEYVLVKADTNLQTVYGFNYETNSLDDLNENPYSVDEEIYEDGTVSHFHLLWEEGTPKDEELVSNRGILSIMPEGYYLPQYLCYDAATQRMYLSQDEKKAAKVEVGRNNELILDKNPIPGYLVYEVFETQVYQYYAYQPLSVEKLSEYTEQPLAGATFTLSKWEQIYVESINYNRMVWQEKQTNIPSQNNGIIALSNMTSGVYKLEETSAPEGYESPTTTDYIIFSFQNGILDIPEDPTKIMTTGFSQALNSDDLKQGSLTAKESTSLHNTIQIYNNISIVLPETGGEGIAVYVFGGAGLICLSLIGFTRRKLEK